VAFVIADHYGFPRFAHGTACTAVRRLGRQREVAALAPGHRRAPCPRRGVALMLWHREQVRLAGL